jgi:hypothetical protein
MDQGMLEKTFRPFNYSKRIEFGVIKMCSRKTQGFFEVLLALCFILIPLTGLQANFASKASINFLSLATMDGLSVHFSKGGRVGGVTISGRELELTSHKGGFSICQVGGTTNLISNPDFEHDNDGDNVPDNWKHQGKGSRPKISNLEAHSGANSIQISLGKINTSGKLMTTVAVESNTHYFLRVWIKSKSVKPTAPPARTWSLLSPVRVKVVQYSGQSSKGQDLAYGYTDDADWHQANVGFLTKPGITHVRVYLVFQEGSGTVWFDDLFLGKLLREPEFPIIKSNIFDNKHKHMTQAAFFPASKISLNAKFKSHPEYIKVDATVSTKIKRDLPFQLCFTLPINFVGWKWANHVRSETLISSGHFEYATDYNLSIMSRYPFNTIYDKESSLSLGIPIGKPRIFKGWYDNKGFHIAFSLGLSNQAGDVGKSAQISFVIYKSDPNWGFRAATKKYYRIFPVYFKKRIDSSREGAWLTLRSGASVKALSTFLKSYGIGLHLVYFGLQNDDCANAKLAAKSVHWAKQNDILIMVYNHHWVYRYKLENFTGTVPTYEEAIAAVKRNAKAIHGLNVVCRKNIFSTAALQSTATDINGRYLYELYKIRRPIDKKYTAILQFYENLSHSIEEGVSDWAKIVYRYYVQETIKLAQQAQLSINGIHMDSTSGMRRWAAADDYNKKHWISAKIPLSFSYDSGKVVQKLSLTGYSHLKNLADFLHHRGLLLSANFNGSEARAGSWFGADVLDFFGIEQGLAEKAGKNDRYVTIDSFAMYKRTVAYQRPVSTLGVRLKRNQTPLEDLETTLSRNLFYGFWHGHHGRYGEEPLKDPHRKQVYDRYLPAFRSLAAAGWEPVTYAKSSNPDVWVERFGNLSDGDLNFTLRNETDQFQSFELAINFRALENVLKREAISVKNVLNDKDIKVTFGEDGNIGIVTGLVPPYRTLLLAIN